MLRNITVGLCFLCCIFMPLNAQTSNQAKGKPTQQSSTASSGTSDRAVDDNNNTFTQTNSQLNSWWQVDLQSDTNIDLIKLFKGSTSLSNFYIFISDSDLSSRSYSDILSDCSVEYIFVSENIDESLNIPVSVSGRYVRIQLADTNILSLAEVEVFQDTSSNAVCTDFCLIENFDNKLNGSIRDQDGWVANPPGALDGAIVDSEPNEAFTGKALMLDPNNVQFRGNAYKPLNNQSIVEGDSGTLFFQLLTEDLANTSTSIGLSDLIAPRLTDSGTGQLDLENDFEVQLILKNGQIGIQNGGSADYFNNIQLENNVVYNIWLVADNQNDSFQVFVQGGAHVFPAQAEITGGVNTFTFRNNTTASLQSLYFLNDPNQIGNSLVYLDQFYLDNQKENLSIPVEVSSISKFTLIENFENLNLGNINGQDQWIANTDDAKVATDPEYSTNQIMTFDASEATVYRDIPDVRDCETGTLFFRMKRNGSLNENVGFSDVQIPSEYADFESQINISGDELNVRDGGSFRGLEDLDNDLWYCVWMVSDNTTDTYKIYIQGNDEEKPRLLRSDINYRNGSASNALTTFLMKQSQRDGITGTFSIDDIYLHHNEENLTHPHTDTCIHEEPIPDPSQPLDNPIVERIHTDGLGLILEEFVTIPASNGGNPNTRINFLDHANDGSGRLFVNDLNDKLHVIINGNVSTYLDVSAQFPYFAEEPRLGSGFGFFAFHPEFANNGKFYTVHTERFGALSAYTPDYTSAGTDDMHGIITEWTASDSSANVFSGTKREVIRIGFDTYLHGFQQIGFNPNATPGSDDYGLLYLALGDGEENPVFSGAPQDLSTPHGKLLRIDPQGNNAPNGNYGIPSNNPFVGNAGALGEIYVYGFRNPHRFSWDTEGTNKMFIGNIGEKNVDGVYIGEPGANYGWNEREGSFLFKTNDPNNVYPLPAVDNFGYTYPVAEYDHDEGFALVGGFVYRGNTYPDLQGKYIFGDVVKGRIFYTEESDMISGQSFAEIKEFIIYDENLNQTSFLNLADYSRADLRFGMDANGELYALSKQNGKIWRIKGERTLSTDAIAEATEVKVFPNPVKDVLNIKWNNSFQGNAEISIVNQLGQSIKTINAKSFSGRVQVSLSDLPSGLYLVNVFTGTVNHSVKVIKN
ncbi:T9SS type A sorting domain-containing protein [Tamlana haliotis]|uniref:T9SS type A sorting domain-containing protein n=1 Tax=Pseudotamlana haliotis TaxID=2614804 RepID=A0A6N6MN48_9FLAO|nr:PQQ-dependent sugar dehydrogenase [Tamlana haliotis]KAB1071361.1 T9SS type A sorting domain-containing protein [Tamlana haliotis]